MRAAVGAVHIKDVVLDGHNRQGMSVCGGMINLTVEDSVFSNTAGHAPACEHHNDLRWPCLTMVAAWVSAQPGCVFSSRRRCTLTIISLAAFSAILSAV